MTQNDARKRETARLRAVVVDQRLQLARLAVAQAKAEGRTERRLGTLEAQLLGAQRQIAALTFACRFPPRPRRRR